MRYRAGLWLLTNDHLTTHDVRILFSRDRLSIGERGNVILLFVGIYVCAFTTHTRVATLHSDTQPLHQELGWPRLSCHRRNPVSEVAEEVGCLLAQRTKWLDRHWLEAVYIEPTVSDISPFSNFLPRSPQRRQIARNGSSDLVAKVSGHVKSHIMQLPLAQGNTVKPSGRFPSSLDNEFGSSTARRDIGWRQSSLDEVVDSVVSHMMTSGLATSEAMNTRAVYLHATDTRVWCTHCGTKTQRDGNTQWGVIEPRSYWRAGNGVQEVARYIKCRPIYSQRWPLSQKHRVFGIHDDTSKLFQWTAVRKMEMGFPTTPIKSPFDNLPVFEGRTHYHIAHNRIFLFSNNQKMCCNIFSTTNI